MPKLMVTGGAGFIGCNFVRYMLDKYPDYHIVVFDKLTYAGRLENLQDVKARHPQRFNFVQGDICEAESVDAAIARYDIDTIVNFAAETHVDRSIMDPDAFIRTDVYGTYVLLEAARRAGNLRYHQISTDEVYGHIHGDHRSLESDSLAPRSPYAASKAAGDHLVRSYFHTYGLPTITTNGSNTFGPRQYPEKLIPLCLTRALAGEPLPIYGDGRQVRDWLYVADHCRGVMRALAVGKPGETYAIGGGNELVNIDTIRILCRILDEEQPRADGDPYAELITHVTDRPGHDRRYALDSRKAHEQLGWRPTESFPTALRETVRWYLANPGWLEHVGRRSRGG